MANARVTKQAVLIAFVVLSTTVVGFFTGLQSPVRPTGNGSAALTAAEDGQTRTGDASQFVLPATQYSNMPAANELRATAWMTSLAALKNDTDPLAEITILPGEKESALQARNQRRAYNGAPPTIPHPVDQLSDQACIVCHGEGVKTLTLRIPRMSHQFLINCTQCHVESNAQHMRATLFRKNEFAGLPAPAAGPRAFSDAPPMIPHSTWMRSDCMSCHGPAGLHGIRTTHPWRHNCQQCHAPSAVLDQTELGDEVRFLSPPRIEDNSSSHSTNNQMP